MTTKKGAMEFDENMAISTIGDYEYRWLDPMECREIDILGFQWLEENQDYYRMPKSKCKLFSVAVNSIAENCSGGQLRFYTDTTRIAIDAEFEAPHSMYHMTPVAQNGFDCYMGRCGNMKFAATLNFDPKKRHYTAPLFVDVKRSKRYITINFPLYNSRLKKLKIGIEPDAMLKSVRHPKNKVVVYGTSITQGGCATRPGMSYTNILSRQINAEFINLGFSGNGKGEPDVIETIASINDMDLCIIDYEANIGEGIFDNLPNVIKILRNAQPELPILILSTVAHGQENIRLENRRAATKRRNFQKKLVEKLHRSGDKKIDFYDGSTFFGDADPGEFAVDGCHLTDYGFQKVADGLKDIVNGFLTSG